MAKQAAQAKNSGKDLVKKPQPAQNNPLAALNQNLTLPDYLQDDQMEGVEGLGRYVVPPRLKIVQAQSGEQFAEFDIGTVLLVPQMIVVANVGQPFYIIPFFMFAEFCTWNPWVMKAQLPTIRNRTFDPTSEIAIKSRNKETWFEICPEAPQNKQNDEKYKIRHCEHINYMCVLTGDHELAGTPFVISFHHSGFRDGQNLASLIKLRRASIYAGQYECKTESRNNDLGNWEGLAISNPSAESGVSPWVSPEDLPILKSQYQSYQEMFTSGSLRPEYEDETQEAGAPSSGGKF